MNKLIGGILLIVGTSIGAGMLALPVTTAPGGFIGATILLFLCWLLMTFSALVILEVNLWMPRDSNLVYMAKMTLGRVGEAIAWLAYLLLFYSLIAAYISAGGDVLHGIINSTFHWTVSQAIASVIFLLLLGAVVFQGIKPVDYVNRFLMSAKLLAFIVLIIFILPHIFMPRLTTLHIRVLIPAVTVVITSFGFASIIPSLRSYFNDDAKKLRFVVIVGSFIPLVCYIAWIGVILGNVPMTGIHGLFAMLTSSDPNTSLLTSLNVYLQNSWINEFAHIFTSICVATSFLGVSISTTDFLSDGFKIKKVGAGKWLIHALCFIPPLLVALFYPGAFIACLSYAGICCVVILVVLPVMMAWRGRYQLKLATSNGYRVLGGRTLLILAFLAGLLVILQNIRVTF